MLIILLLIIFFHVAAAVLLFVATIHNVSTNPLKKRNQRPKVDRSDSDSETFCVSIKPTSAEKCFQPAGFHNQSASFSRDENKEANFTSHRELR